MSGLNKYVKPIIKNFNELTSFPTYREVTTSFPIYREVGSFFSRLPRSWENRPKFTKRLNTAVYISV